MSLFRKHLKSGIWALVFIAGVVSCVGHAEPTQLRTMPGGFIFPAYQETPWVNAARLAGDERTAFSAEGSPESPDGANAQYRGSLILGGADVGVGLTLDDRDTSLGFPRIALGGSIKLPSLSWGFVLRDNNLTDSNFPDAALSLLATDNNIGYGMIFRREQDRASIDLGVGFSNRKNYTFEFNASIPTFFQSTVTPPYTFTVAALVYHGFLGAGVRSAFEVNTNRDFHTISGVFTPFEALSFTGSITLPEERYWLGILFLW